MAVNCGELKELGEVVAGGEDQHWQDVADESTLEDDDDGGGGGDDDDGGMHGDQNGNDDDGDGDSDDDDGEHGDKNGDDDDESLLVMVIDDLVAPVWPAKVKKSLE